jgi:hypothetical protein
MWYPNMLWTKLFLLLILFSVLIFSCSIYAASGLHRRMPIHAIRCLARLKSESIIINTPQCREEHEEEERPSEQVENSVKDHLVVYRENVGTLGKGPADWVKQPNDGGVPCAASVHVLVGEETRHEPSKK